MGIIQKLRVLARAYVMWILELLRKLFVFQFPVIVLATVYLSTRWSTRDIRFMFIISGFVLQAAGTLWTLRQLLTRHRIFGEPNLWHQLAAWYEAWCERRPRWRRDVVAAAAMGSASATGAAVRVVTEGLAGPGPSLEARVQTLERRLGEVSRQQAEHEKMSKKELKAIQERITAVKAELSESVDTISKQIRRLAVDDALHEFTGVFWLLLGLLAGVVGVGMS